MLVQKYCRHHRIFRITIIEACETPLFYNATLKKRLSVKDAKAVIDYMVSADGDERAEWLGPEKSAAWIWWRKPEEWATLISTWVEETGQKGTVLTLYELVQGESTEKQEFYGLDTELLRKSLNTLVKKGKAQVFGADDQQGIKFFDDDFPWRQARHGYRIRCLAKARPSYKSFYSNPSSCQPTIHTAWSAAVFDTWQYPRANPGEQFGALFGSAPPFA